MSLKLNASKAECVHVSCDGKCPSCRKTQTPRLVEVRDLGYNEDIDALMRGNNGHAGLR